MNESCYWVLSPEWYFCFSQAKELATPRIFGFAEFIAALALLVIVYTIIDPRYRFRTSIAPVPIGRLTFFVIGLVGLGSLLTEVWLAQGWLVLQINWMTRVIWQAILGFIFLGTFMVWIWYAFIRPPVFCKANSLRFAQEIYQAILRGGESELNVIADELARSAKSIIAHSETIANRRERSEKRKDENAGVGSIAYELILLLANRKFCRSVVASCPGTAIELLDQVSRHKKFDIPIGGFIENISTEAFLNKDSLIYHEVEGGYSGLLGYIKPLSTALYGDYELIVGLGSGNYSSLDISYEIQREWEPSQWRAYCKASIIFVKAYLKSTDGENVPPVLFRNIEAIKSAFSDLYKLDGLESDFYNTDAYQRFQIATNHVRELLEVMESNINISSYTYMDKKSSKHKDIYDLVAGLMFSLIHSGSAIKSPAMTAWTVHHNELWATFFLNGKSGSASKIVQHKLRRLLYDEIVRMNTFPNYLGARILGLCLNVMGLKKLSNSYDRNAKPLSRVVRKWVENNFYGLYQNSREVAEAVLIGSISYDPLKNQLIKTYQRGISQKVAQTDVLQL